MEAIAKVLEDLKQGRRLHLYYSRLRPDFVTITRVAYPASVASSRVVEYRRSHDYLIDVCSVLTERDVVDDGPGF